MQPNFTPYMRSAAIVTLRYERHGARAAHEYVRQLQWLGTISAFGAKMRPRNAALLEASILTPTAATVLSALHLLLAAGVTGHILVHKRDPGSAVAWIGIAWLSPVLGSLLYVLLGVNRVRRRALTMLVPRAAVPLAGSSGKASEDDYLAPLEYSAERITGRPAKSGNAIGILHNGDEAYPQMLACIAAARHSVALSSYIFRADVAGNAFIEALANVRRCGVEVRVLIDGVGGGYFWSRTYFKLRRAGVPVARFLHSTVPWRMSFLNLRSHKKLLVIDGRIAFIGGLNIGAENLVQSEPAHPVLDTHFSLEGPVVAQIMRAFADDWLFMTGEDLSGGLWFPALAAVGDSVARAITSGPDQDLEKIELMIMQAVGAARSSVKVMTPYFLPDDRIITALALAAMRGVEVDIILPANSNHPTLDWGARAHVGPLLAAECRIWTHGAPFNHSKLMTVDGRWCLIGSANWDMRSFRLNFELNMEIYQSALVQQVDALITGKQELRLSAASLQKLSLPVVLRNNAARLLLPYL
jgi:cardiolipin synthase